MADDDDQGTLMYRLTTGPTVSPGNLPDMMLIQSSDDLFERLDRRSAYYPTGLSVADVGADDVKPAVQRGGLVVFPLNLVNWLSSTTPASDFIVRETVPLDLITGHNQGTDHGLQALTATKKEFLPEYLSFDYGFTEGKAYAHPYSRTEVVFGLILDHVRMQTILDRYSWTYEEAMNNVLGPIGNVDLAVSGSSWPRRSIGSIQVTGAADLEMVKDVRRLKGLIQVLKRDSNVHRPVKVPSAEDDEAFEIVGVETLGRLFGSGSYTFPSAALKVQEKKEDMLMVYGWRSPFPSGSLTYPITRRNIPFMFVRSDALADDWVDQPYTSSASATAPGTTQADLAMGFQMRYKMKIRDNGT